MSPFCNLTSLSSVDIKKRNQLSSLRNLPARFSGHLRDKNRGRTFPQYLRYLRETKKFDFFQKNEIFVKII